MNTITIFEIIERADLKREYIEAVAKHIDKGAFVSHSVVEVEPWLGQIEDFLWNLMNLDFQTRTEIANELVRQSEPAFEIDGVKYQFSKDATWTATVNDNKVAKGYWMDPASISTPQ